MTPPLPPPGHHHPRRHGNLLRASADVALAMCGDVTQCCGNVLLFITRWETEKNIPPALRAKNASSDQGATLARCNQARRLRVGVRAVVSEEHLAGKRLREQSAERHAGQTRC